jgi:hypothetical protein
MLGQSVAIAQIAKATDLSRQTVYCIKDNPEGAEAALKTLTNKKMPDSEGLHVMSNAVTKSPARPAYAAELNDQEWIFVEAYVDMLNSSQAAKHAGFKDYGLLVRHTSKFKRLLRGRLDEQVLGRLRDYVGTHRDEGARTARNTAR